MESILETMRKRLVGSEEDESFDNDLIMDINTVFSTLTQMGVGPSVGFEIEDANAEWTDFISDYKKIGFVKSYMYLKVRLLFDPPASSALTDAINKQLTELEWRMNLEAESTTTQSEEGNQNGVE